MYPEGGVKVSTSGVSLSLPLKKRGWIFDGVKILVYPFFCHPRDGVKSLPRDTDPYPLLCLLKFSPSNFFLTGTSDYSVMEPSTSPIEEISERCRNVAIDEK